MKSIIGIVGMVLFFAVLIKTKSLGSAIGFIFKWCLLPGLIAFVCGLLFGKTGRMLGLVVGYFIVFSTYKGRMQGSNTR